VHLLSKKLDVEIEDDGGVEVDVEFARGLQINIENYPMYAEN